MIFFFFVGRPLEGKTKQRNNKWREWCIFEGERDTGVDFSAVLLLWGDDLSTPMHGEGGRRRRRRRRRIRIGQEEEEEGEEEITKAALREYIIFVYYFV